MNNNNYCLRLVFSCLILLTSLGASATTVTYTTTNVSGNTWQNTYTVANDGTLSIPIEEFTIFFNYTLYANLMLATAPAGWDPLAIDPDTNIPDDGFYDALSLSPADAINPGNALSGFSIQFDYLGTGSPGSQPFDIIDPLTFNTIDQGATTQVIPLPAAAWLFISGLVPLIGQGLRRRRNCS